MSKNAKSIHTSANIAMVREEKYDNDDEKDKKMIKPRVPVKTSPWVYGALVLFAVISYVTIPDPLQPPHGQHPSIQHVFYYGWLTAISTGLGALPLVFSPSLGSYWVGISNGTLRYIDVLTCFATLIVCMSVCMSGDGSKRFDLEFVYVQLLKNLKKLSYHLLITLFIILTDVVI